MDKDTPSQVKPVEERSTVESFLETYALLGCLICCSHSCERGEYGVDNERRHFSVEVVRGLGPLLRKKVTDAAKAKGGRWFPGTRARAWSETEILLLESFLATLSDTNIPVQCATAVATGRPCWDVNRHLDKLDITHPVASPPPAFKVKPVPCCACHSQGKACLSKQKDGQPCICVQLNRECEPTLCGSCGALERVNPRNADNDQLYMTGCQNCALQRGKAKSLVLGKSTIENCGYGLFAAEDIAQDEFVIEYVGELFSEDEDVRREARRGDVFNEEANASYLFTLLEQEGIWVDAAIYGNLSRYINHQDDGDRRGLGCNIISQDSLRLWKGEEPKSNKDDSNKPKRPRGRPPKNRDGKPKNKTFGSKPTLDDDEDNVPEGDPFPNSTPKARKHKRVVANDGSDDEEYRPDTADSDAESAPFNTAGKFPSWRQGVANDSMLRILRTNQRAMAFSATSSKSRGVPVPR
ncbi:SET domain-containing protein [Zopfia rhizophila CBS 207.26]|uniref:SET domain-containing protein n=1 Tax=Zopfia rhizophila CBS 207.26 TaxID=1314779 RepID=A0A6A6ESW6_9PEZI|nr:SET domain-containing protein [Zopfia rhizophila CBS 207.26]